jgi:hypothetical protein
MRWEVVVNEKLSTHKEEGKVVYSPDQKEESSRVPDHLLTPYEDCLRLEAQGDHVVWQRMKVAGHAFGKRPRQ